MDITVITGAPYLAFLAALFALHALCPRRLRGPLLVGASLLFYASYRWDHAAVLVALLVGFGLFDWAWARWVLAGREFGWPLAIGIAVNLAPLVFFKYSAFLVRDVIHPLGIARSFTVPALLVPLGISFWTFQGISYLVDVASGEEPLGLGDFLLFRTFWPQLLQGPIVRVGEIRDSLRRRETAPAEERAAAVGRIVYGLFKKVVVADPLGRHADAVFAAFGKGGAPGWADAVLGLLAYGTSLYIDFSAYCDIAIGSARLLGFSFPENFDWPYGAPSPQAFWKRWHMTLSRWIQDYLYTPMSFAAARRMKPLLPLCVVTAMALCGLWHGAAWTFVLWGVWHGVWLAINQGPLRRFFAAPRKGAPPSARLRVVAAWAVTFAVVTYGWLLFRSTSLAEVGRFTAVLARPWRGLRPEVLGAGPAGAVIAFTLLAVLGSPLSRSLDRLRVRIPAPLVDVLRPAVYITMLVAVMAETNETRGFVYLQF